MPRFRDKNTCQVQRVTPSYHRLEDNRKTVNIEPEDTIDKFTADTILQFGSG